ncbi:di-trans,poly-cis-decaprenylcistransferase [Candidatus Giovannonibacteria bacterium]|nr:di-trans,poly-cis-decaprenylcistransferase [Candidatus Giovannonibacteria bacterium]
MDTNLGIKHVAIIADGNRRWAKGKGLPSFEGHREGEQRFREISRAALEMKIPFLSIWALSEDNIAKRSKFEIDFILSLLENELTESLSELDPNKNEVRFRLIGRWKEIFGENSPISRLAADSMQKTEKNDKFNLTLLFGYDGKKEMAAAIQKIIESGKKKVEENDIKNALWTAELPPVDLVIRTGGEPHWSGGFMMWHTANSQFYFTDKFWPDFGKAEFNEALLDYSRRTRRLGS